MTTPHQKVTHAILWSALDILIRQGLQFVVLIVLARILAPEDFGLIAMLGFFVGISGVFIDCGFSTALIQRQDVTHVDESTIFFFNLAMGMVFGLLLCAIDSWIAMFFSQSDIHYLLYAMALNLFLNTLGSIHTTLLNKELNFKTITRVGWIASLLSGSLAIILAIYGFGVWSLAGQTLTGSVISVLFLWAWHPWRPIWVFSFASLRSFFRFGSYLMVTTLFEVLHNFLYSILIGKFYSLADVGLYDRAQKTQLSLGNIITTIINRIAIPSFSKSAGNREKLKLDFRKGLRLTMFVNIPLMLGLIVMADPIVRFIFGARWLSCVPVLRILGLVGLLLPVHVFNTNVLLAQGRSDLLFRIMLLKRGVAVSLTVISSFYGIIAIAWAQVLASAFSFVVNTHYSAVFLNFGAVKQLRALFPYLVAGCLAGIGMWGFLIFMKLPVLLDHMPVFFEIFFTGIGGGYIYLLVCRWLHLEAFSEIIQLLPAKKNVDAATAISDLEFGNMPLIEKGEIWKEKVFCIGANKTGTTSIEAVFNSLGLKVGEQGTAELFIHNWAKHDYKNIIEFCKGAEAFQDIPFSYPGTYEAMDKAFPGSKFILSVRNNADEWYESLLRYHTKLAGKGRTPTADDLYQFNYHYPGYLWDAARLRYGIDETTLYDRTIYTHCYEEHNRKILEYFENRPTDLLVLNVADEDAMERLLTFLGYRYMGQKMPHENSSRSEF